MKVWVVSTVKKRFVFTDVTSADLFCAMHNDCCHDHHDLYTSEVYDTMGPEDVQAPDGAKPHYEVVIVLDLRRKNYCQVQAIPTLKPLSGFAKTFDGVFFKQYEAIFATNDTEVIKKFFYDWCAQEKEEGNNVQTAD